MFENFYKFSFSSIFAFTHRQGLAITNRTLKAKKLIADVEAKVSGSVLFFFQVKIAFEVKFNVPSRPSYRYLPRGMH